MSIKHLLFKKLVPASRTSRKVQNEETRQESPKYLIFVDGMLAFSSLIVALSAAFGSYVAYIAIDVYRENNFTATHSRIEVRDLALAEKIYNNTEFALIYSDINEFPTKTETISRYLQDRGALSLTPELMERYKVETIEAMNCHLWSPDEMFSSFGDIVPSYMFAEAHLLLLYDVWLTFVSKESRYLDDNRQERVVNNYLGYLQQIGTDFMFLMSVYETARRGYHSPEFYNWLREELLKRNPDIDFFAQYFPTYYNKETWQAFLEGASSAAAPCVEIMEDDEATNP